jgi:hypothetical protein
MRRADSNSGNGDEVRGHCQAESANCDYHLINEHTSGSVYSSGLLESAGDSWILPYRSRLKPTSDSVISIEVWIPTTQHWNREFLGVGNGGYSGAIQYTSLADAIKRGFAGASTDTGHSGADLTFAAGHPEKIVDWGYRAIHVMTESAKLIIRDYSGALPNHSFFMGCSTGGHQALSEVQRYPGDYDGVVAGDPGNNRVHLNVGFLWAFAATHDSSGNTILPTSKLPLINKAAVEACDAADGVTDGIISNPQACHFDPGVLLCKGEENDQCLTAPQIAAVRKVYSGPRNPRTGEQIIAGYSPGSESLRGMRGPVDGKPTLQIATNPCAWISGDIGYSTTLNGTGTHSTMIATLPAPTRS